MNRKRDLLRGSIKPKFHHNKIFKQEYDKQWKLSQYLIWI